MEELLKAKNDASTLIIGATSLEELTQIRLNVLGKNGTLTGAIKQIANLPEEERPEVGRLANEIKNTIESLLDQKEEELAKKAKKREVHAKIDITLPGKRPPFGHLHLVTQTIEEITAIFEKIGFTRRRYPEVEWDFYAFEALNFPENHPARDDWETFFIEEDVHEKYGPMLLTPHTSSGQIREMQRMKPPIKMLNIAKTYRRQTDVSHTAMFHQFETLCVGEGISITHLKGVLEYFVKSYFGKMRKSRIRPYHFQFTEPSFETDVSCGVCNGTGLVSKNDISTRHSRLDRESIQILDSRTRGNDNREVCRFCKGGWLELGGAGMVHPNVLKACGVDPKKYTGFASGWGVERVLMMREGINLDDLRMLYSTNLDFLEQF